MYQFPANLAQQSTSNTPIMGAGKPLVRFQAMERTAPIADGLIHLPFPSTLSISDGATYNEVQLGALGALKDPAEALAQGDVIKAKDDILNKVKNLTWSGIGKYVATAGSQMLPQEGKELFAISTKRIINPNTNMSFQSNTVRTYSFSFTLVARDPSDSNQIRDIHKAFRKYIYAKSTENAENVLLDYPPVWSISFHDVINGTKSEENKWIPPPAPSYLTTLQTDFNPSGPIFRPDGSPMEITLSLQFTETRALTRTEIEEIQDKLRGSKKA